LTKFYSFLILRYQRAAEIAISGLGQLMVWPIIGSNRTSSHYLDYIGLCNDHSMLRKVQLVVGLLLSNQIVPSKIPQFPLGTKYHMIIDKKIRSLSINKIVLPISDPL
jgi:hypothetical protein